MTPPRNFDIQPVQHWTEIRENGVLVAKVYKTFHPAIPFEVFMKVGTLKAKALSTISEVVDFVLENSSQS